MTMVFLVGPNRREAIAVLHKRHDTSSNHLQDLASVHHYTTGSNGNGNGSGSGSGSGNSKQHPSCDTLLDLTTTTDGTEEESTSSFAFTSPPSSPIASKDEEAEDSFRLVEMKPVRPFLSLFRGSNCSVVPTTTAARAAPATSNRRKSLPELRAQLHVQRQRFSSSKRLASSSRQQRQHGPPIVMLPLTSGELHKLIKTLFSCTDNVQTVAAALWRLHQVVLDQQQQQLQGTTTSEKDNKSLVLARTVWVNAGHLGILQAMQNFPHTGAVQAMGFHLLAWQCQACAMKRELHSRGILRIVAAAWQNFCQTSPWVWNQSLALLTQLATIPKVAKVFVPPPPPRGNSNSNNSNKDSRPPPLLQALHAGIQRWKIQNSSPETIDQTLALIHALAVHGRLTGRILPVLHDILQKYWCHEQQQQQQQQQAAAEEQAATTTMQEGRLIVICTIVTQWAIEAAKVQDMPVLDFGEKESQGSSMTKTWESLVSDMAQLADKHNCKDLQDAAQDCQVALQTAKYICGQRNTRPW